MLHNSTPHSRTPCNSCNTPAYRLAPGLTASALPSYLPFRFTRDAALLQRVGQVLLQHPASKLPQQQHPKPQPFKPRWLVAQDAFTVADTATTQAIYDRLSGPRFEQVTAVLGKPEEVPVAGAAMAADGLQLLGSWVDVFRITQVRYCHMGADPSKVSAWCVRSMHTSESWGLQDCCVPRQQLLRRGAVMA